MLKNKENDTLLFYFYGFYKPPKKNSYSVSILQQVFHEMVTFGMFTLACINYKK